LYVRFGKNLVICGKTCMIWTYLQYMVQLLWSDFCLFWHSGLDSSAFCFTYFISKYYVIKTHFLSEVDKSSLKCSSSFVSFQILPHSHLNSIVIEYLVLNCGPADFDSVYTCSVYVHYVPCIRVQRLAFWRMCFKQPVSCTSIMLHGITCFEPFFQHVHHLDINCIEFSSCHPLGSELMLFWLACSHWRSVWHLGLRGYSLKNSLQKCCNKVWWPYDQCGVIYFPKIEIRGQWYLRDVNWYVTL
jgi:hypothetical protein